MKKKLILDFDDVLFHNTKLFKEHMFRLIGESGIPEVEARKYYAKPEVREKEFSLRKFIKDLFSFYEIYDSETSVEDLYRTIMYESRHFLNLELIEKIKRIGLENCYIVTNGDREFNTDKLKYSGIWDLFGGEKRIRIVPRSKAKTIREICESDPSSEFVFIDDKLKFINEPELKDILNLTTIHYKSEEFEELMRKIEGENTASELKRRK